jgi:Concanavalin A-like lectin/glucanases superfamily
MTYRPFTLEGNFAAMQAAQEMLLQSWSPTPGKRDTEVIRIFPAAPWRWHDASFTDLRAEGGHRVSAKRQNNVTTSFEVTAGRDGIVRIRDNFGDRTPHWSLHGVHKVATNYEVTLKKGQTISATLPAVDTIPAEPADMAVPVVSTVASSIQPTQISLHIGCDSASGTCFAGDMARILVAGRALTKDEIATLADRNNANWASTKGVILALDATKPPESQNVQVLPADGDLTGMMFHFDGKTNLVFPDKAELRGQTGLTMAAWIRLSSEPPASGMRIIDKSPIGTTGGYLLDTYPKDSLRIITSPGHFIFPAKLPVGKWIHVAATVDGTTGKRCLYVDGKSVAAE